MPAPAVAGDFASANPNRYSTLSGPGGFVAGALGVFVGQFAWLSQMFVDPNNAATIVNSFGNGVPDGFVARPSNPAIITTFLADATMLVNPGQPTTLHSGGDFWVVNNGTTQAIPKQKAYANLTSGQVSFGATGSPTNISPAVTGAVATNTTPAFTGSISGNVLTVSAVSAGNIYPGEIIAGAGVATGTQVLAQLTSTAGGGALGTTGTYALSIGEQTVASESMTGSYGVFTVSGGTPVSGGTLTGASAGTTVWGQLTPTTWVVSPSQTAASVTQEISTVETKWFAASGGLPGELVKITDVVQ
jgi:hypothetical protein